jgi:hypothetical protein
MHVQLNVGSGQRHCQPRYLPTPRSSVRTPRTFLRNRPTPCVTVWADDRHDRLKAIGEDDAGTCPGRSPTSCLESPANHAGQCYVRGVPTIGRPHGGSNQFRATDPTGTTSDEPDDEKQNNATYAGVDGSY